MVLIGKVVKNLFLFIFSDPEVVYIHALLNIKTLKLCFPTYAHFV